MLRNGDEAMNYKRLRMSFARVARYVEVFVPKNTNLGIFWRALRWKILVYFMVAWHFIAIWVRSVANWYFCGHFRKFLPFLFFVPRKIWQP
jgi:hypothetical protein